MQEVKVQGKILSDGGEILEVEGISVEENIGWGWYISLGLGISRKMVNMQRKILEQWNSQDEWKEYAGGEGTKENVRCGGEIVKVEGISVQKILDEVGIFHQDLELAGRW